MNLSSSVSGNHFVSRSLLGRKASHSSISFKGSVYLNRVSQSASFLDQTHMNFYGLTSEVVCSSAEFGKRKLKKKLRKQKVLSPLGEDCALTIKTKAGAVDSVPSAMYETVSPENSFQLSDLVLEIKQLKARVSRLEKNADSSSSSSSSSSDSSDSSDGEMKSCKKGRKKVSNLRAPCAPSIVTEDPAISEMAARMLNMPISEKLSSQLPDELGQMQPTFNLSDQRPSSQAVQVCLGKKCRQQGAEEILATLQQRSLPNGSAVEAIACFKCMKKCKYAPNVRVEVNNGSDNLVAPVSSADDVIELLCSGLSQEILV